MEKCPLCGDPANGMGLVHIFTSAKHAFMGCQACEVAYCLIKEEEEENGERKEDT